MSFLLRPAILTNHVVMFLLYLAGLWLVAPALAILLSLNHTEYLAPRLVLMVSWVQALWIFAVSIELQHWQSKWTPRLIWYGIWLTVLASVLFASGEFGEIPDKFLRAGLSVAVLALAIQIACRLEKKGLGARALHSLLVLLWPLTISLFANRLRADLERAQLKRASQLS